MESIMSKSEQELAELRKDIDVLEQSQSNVKEKGIKLKEQTIGGFKTLDEICSTLEKQEKELGKLKSRISTLLNSNAKSSSATVNNTSSSSSSSSSTTNTSTTSTTFKEEIQELKSKTALIGESIKQLKRTYTPETGGMFVRLFLGQVNVKHYREGERFRLKTEYEKFKFKTNPQFLFFVILLFFFPHSSFVTTSWQIWLLYYYVTLALRENILKVNGSSIRPWWIIHHYLSIIGSLTNLLWPLSDSFTHLLPQMTIISGAQGIVQILTNRYQQGQLYRMVAIGKATIMDVTSENMISDPGWTPSAMFLLPFLLTVQTLQLYNGISFLLYAYGKRSIIEWQVIACGIVFLVLGTGNLITTLSTYYRKWTSHTQSSNSPNFSSINKKQQ